MDSPNAFTEEPADSWIFVAESRAVNYGSQEIGPDKQEHQSEESDTESISIIAEDEPDNLCSVCTDPFIDSFNSNIDYDANSKTALPLCDKEHPWTEIQEQPDVDIDLSGSNIKTYVHKKNANLNTMLNVILLGTVLTATGLAIGHMWGVQDDCVLHSNTSVTEVLYNLHKLQKENQFLRNKLMEMEKTRLNTVAANVAQQNMASTSVNNKDLDRNLITEKDKWEHIDDPTVISQMKKSINRDDFEQQINRLNSIYGENKDWLDKEIANRLRRDNHLLKQTHSTVTDDGRIVPIVRKTNTVKIKSIPINSQKKHSTKKEHKKIDIDAIENTIITTSFIGPLTFEEYAKQNNEQKNENANVSNLNRCKISVGKENENDCVLVKSTVQREGQIETNPNKKLYSEALKNLKENRQNTSIRKTHSEKDINNINKEKNLSGSQTCDQKTVKNNVNGDLNTVEKKRFLFKKRDKSDIKEIKNKKFKSNDSDDDVVVKDRRYVGQKRKFEGKKDNRQKSNKKQKNEDKYKQWEMKRGYLNNDDAKSMESLDEQPKYSDSYHPSQVSEIVNYMNQYTDDLIKHAKLVTESKNVEKDESEFNRLNTDPQRKSKENVRRIQSSSGEWYSKLANSRKEMRDKKMLVNVTSQNKAQWYFERMDHRERRRKQVKNITKNFRNVHNAKRSMNYKTKH